MTQRQIFHIECGDKNWTPTRDELVNICNMFMHARDDEKGGIVATRNGVKVKKHAVPEGIAIVASEGEAVVLTPYERLKLEMFDNPGYADVWQSNIAMSIYDNQKGKISGKRANEIANAVMATLFEINLPLIKALSVAEAAPVHTSEDAGTDQHAG